MISLINASAFRSKNEKDRSAALTVQDFRDYLARYASSRIRLWTYSASLSRLVLRIDRPINAQLPPIDLVFISLSDIRCQVHWNVGDFEVNADQDSSETTFAVPSAGVSLLASDLTIVVQNEYPQHCWELEHLRA